MIFESFELLFGYSWRVSASDAVYVIAALLAQYTVTGDGGGDVSDLRAEARVDFWCAASSMGWNGCGAAGLQA